MFLLWFIYVISVLFLLCFRAHLFTDALSSPAGKGLTIWLSFVMPNCEVVTFPFCILSQVWWLIVSIPDLCPLSYSKCWSKSKKKNKKKLHLGINTKASDKVKFL